MDDQQLTLIGHLAEFRRRLIICIITIFVSAIGCYTIVDKIIKLLVKPIGKLVFISPQEVIVTYIKVSFIAGIFVALPIILYQLWRFVSVGLKQTEKKYVLIYGPCSFLMFIIGSLFAYFLVIPLGIKFLLAFANDNLEPMISIKAYISFSGMLLLMFGAIFELPLLIVFLTKIKLVTPKLLREKRKYVIVLIFIIAAILTPPDLITQLFMAGPLIILYEISILLARLVDKDKKSD